MRKKLLLAISIISLALVIWLLFKLGDQFESNKSVKQEKPLIGENIINIDNLMAVSASGKVYEIPSLKSQLLKNVRLPDRHVFFSTSDNVIITDQETSFVLDEGTDYFFEGSYTGGINEDNWLSLSSSYISPRFKGESEEILYLYRDSNDYLIKYFSQANLDGKNWQNIINLENKKYINGIIYPSPIGSKVIISLIDENFSYSSFFVDLNNTNLIPINVSGLITSAQWSPNSQLALLTSAEINGEFQEQALSPLYLFNSETNKISKIKSDRLTHAEGFTWIDDNASAVSWNMDNKVDSGKQVLSLYNHRESTEKMILNYENTKDQKLLITFPTIIGDKIYYLDDSYLRSVDVNLK